MTVNCPRCGKDTADVEPGQRVKCWFCRHVYTAQPTLFDDVKLDAAAGRRLANEGLERAEGHRPALRERYDAAFRRVAATHLLFTVDQLWAELGEMPKPKDGRSGAASAVGGAMRRGMASGLAVQTGEYRLSERPGAHRKPVPVYRSLVYGQGVRHEAG